MNSPLSPADRYRGAIWGQFVGDAAGLGTHWIYDLNDRAAKYPEGVEGFEAPLPGHYHEGKRSGDFTHYGDAALLLLESIAALGQFEEIDFGQRFIDFFTDPACTCYKDHSTRETLNNLKARPGDFQNGADDDQPATVSRLAPLVVAYMNADDAKFFDAVERCTRFSQHNPIAQDYAKAHAMILRSLLRGTDMGAALEEARLTVDNRYTADIIESALALGQQDVITTTQHFGQTCPLPSSFPSTVHAAARHGGSYHEAILETIRAGGDNAGRASMAGAWLGAFHGVVGIPPEWKSQLTQHARIEAAVEKLVAGP